MKIYDISMELKKGMIVYPGDPKFKIKQVKKMPKDSSNLSHLDFGAHTGTHVDSKHHVFAGNHPGVDKIPLTKFYGRAKVLDFRKLKFGEGITAEHLKRFKIVKDDIILLKTKNSFTGFKKFKKDYVYLTDDGAEYLVKNKVKTVGIDYLSIQKFHSGYCASHCVLLKKNVIIFEGLDLSKVPQGTYTFAGLPLKIKGCDGAPARAVLIQ